MKVVDSWTEFADQTVFIVCLAVHAPSIDAGHCLVVRSWACSPTCRQTEQCQTLAVILVVDGRLLVAYRALRVGVFALPTVGWARRGEVVCYVGTDAWREVGREVTGAGVEVCLGRDAQADFALHTLSEVLLAIIAGGTVARVDDFGD